MPNVESTLHPFPIQRSIISPSQIRQTVISDSILAKEIPVHCVMRPLHPAKLRPWVGNVENTAVWA